MNKCNVLYGKKYLVLITLQIKKSCSLKGTVNSSPHRYQHTQKIITFLEGESSNRLDAISQEHVSISGTSGIFNFKKRRLVYLPPFLNYFFGAKAPFLVAKPEVFAAAGTLQALGGPCSPSAPAGCGARL